MKKLKLSKNNKFLRKNKSLSTSLILSILIMFIVVIFFLSGIGVYFLNRSIGLLQRVIMLMI